ncbi:hypothetical protein JTB14_022885 [Gonioctena quinquepunctata]|nr:hypothetical protein JTB14_022885 [Gonioctena quinquepunctata]
MKWINAVKNKYVIDLFVYKIEGMIVVTSQYLSLSLRVIQRQALFICRRCNSDSRDAKDKKSDASNSTQDEKLDAKKTRIFPEEPTTCCMTGCAECVWLEYAEKLSEYFGDSGEGALKEINEKITDPNMKAFLLHELRMKNKK